MRSATLCLMGPYDKIKQVTGDEMVGFKASPAVQADLHMKSISRNVSLAIANGRKLKQYQCLCLND